MRIGERRQAKSSSHLYSRTVTVNFFRLLWIVLLIWGEVGSFFWSLSSCRWPDFGMVSIKSTRILLVSDPQVQIPSSLRQEATWSSSLRQFIFELNLKKSWHVTKRIQPHVVIFLGDMLANGKSINNEAEYQKYVHKFTSIFSLEPSVPVHFIPGNNDIGMGVSSYFSQTIRNNYAKTFGPFNQQITIRNHTFVLLDAPGLVDEDYKRSAHGTGFDKWRAISGGTVAFVKGIVRDNMPLILLSHIPLSRPDTASCGPMREKGTIRQGVGHGYQNTLGKQTTAFLINTLKPSAVFSGDNRDYCDYTHKNKLMTDSNEVREVTVKSFSLANHISHPGFQLLSLRDPVNSNDMAHSSFQDIPCHLPDQYGIYFSTYGMFFICNSIALFVLAIYRGQQSKKRMPLVEPLAISPHSGGHNTPTRDPESAVWSPYTPAGPTSPRSALPTYLRTPSASAGPTFRASRPTTPVGSPSLTPMVYLQEEEDESLYPMQYATRRDSRLFEKSDDWSPGHDRISSDPQIPHFTSAPHFKHVTKHPFRWSWTFVFRGRRRRITLAPPAAIYDFIGTLVFLGREKNVLATRRSALHAACIDGFHVFWPAVLTWGILAWWMYYM